ncbi:hypothetical protein DAPPUDRAFT_104318 [Daphnia pulex]|uniref:Uncharacterized protein n=1 Tax=Daphnia pulex TaxID=6669 RepID=E9GLW9_DAPPU|nr:hypothetical protein DAPPUDRAFT_104318 [Daphnia pulex]|eukprot:EFX79621.1 hypothetical protein DAPPUDRAFT_104318 [Daphnia pulex]
MVTPSVRQDRCMEFVKQNVAFWCEQSSQQVLVLFWSKLFLSMWVLGCGRRDFNVLTSCFLIIQLNCKLASTRTQLQEPELQTKATMVYLKTVQRWLSKKGGGYQGMRQCSRGGRRQECSRGRYQSRRIMKLTFAMFLEFRPSVRDTTAVTRHGIMPRPFLRANKVLLQQEVSGYPFKKKNKDYTVNKGNPPLLIMDSICETEN